MISEDEFNVNFKDFLMKIKEGAVFIHPTDTIYGLGCDATNEKAVEKIRELKERPDSPFSIIAPSKQWIKQNCDLMHHEEWLDNLPGPYTLIVKLKNKNCIAKSVNNGAPTLGVRIPLHWFSSQVNKMQIPIVTTSANRTGGRFMTSIDNLNENISEHVDFIVYEDEKHGNPSILVDLTGKEAVEKKR